jgi:hypothetical protein
LTLVIVSCPKRAAAIPHVVLPMTKRKIVQFTKRVLYSDAYAGANPFVGGLAPVRHQLIIGHWIKEILIQKSGICMPDLVK